MRVDADAARMLQNIGAKLVQENAFLVEDLYLMGRRALSDHDVACERTDRHAVRVQQLPVSLSTCSKHVLVVA